MCLLAAGLYTRLWGLDAYAFNPDEALQLSIAGADGLASVLRIALDEVAHPPGFILLLHGMLRLGDGELYLRSVALLPGLASIPLAFVLGRRALGPAAGLFMAFAVTFGYASVQLSQVLRPYAAITALLLVALLCLVQWEQDREQDRERGRRSAWLWIYGAALGVAALLHLSSVIPTAAIGLVYLARLLRAHGPGREVRAWLAVNAALGVVYLGVFVAVILPLLTSEFRDDAISVFLRTGYPGSDSLVPWIRNVLLLGVYFTSPFAAWSSLVFLVLFAAGVPLLWRRGRGWLALVALVALAANAALALLELYPFSGSRHCSYLFPLLLLPAGCAVESAWSRLRARLPAALRRGAPAAALVAAGACLVGVVHVRAHAGYRAQHANLEFPVTREAYARTLASFEHRVAPGDVVVTEDQTARYALWEGSIHQRERLAPGLSRATLRGRPIYYYDSPKMMLLSAGELLGFLEDLAEVVPLEPETRIWFLSLGFRHSVLYTALASPKPVALPDGPTGEAERERAAFQRLHRTLQRLRPPPLVTGDAEGGGVLYRLRWATLRNLMRRSR
jgi:hypothetical protein